MIEIWHVRVTPALRAKSSVLPGISLRSLPAYKKTDSDWVTIISEWGGGFVKGYYGVQGNLKGLNIFRSKDSIFF